MYDEKRKRIKKDDELIFIKRDNTAQQIKVKVIDLLKYPSFEAMFKDNGPAKFGGSSARKLLTQIRQLYDVGIENKYGVLGIEFLVL